MEIDKIIRIHRSLIARWNRTNVGSRCGDSEQRNSCVGYVLNEITIKNKDNVAFAFDNLR